MSPILTVAEGLGKYVQKEDMDTSFEVIVSKLDWQTITGEFESY